MASTKYKLGQLISLCTGGNEDLIYGEESLRGISVNKEFIETKADLQGISLSGYTVVSPGSFSFVTVTSRNGNRISIAYNNSEETYIVSSFYVTFRLSEFGKHVCLEDYLFLFFCRGEFDRYARINSWGSAREYYWFSDMEDVVIDLPPLTAQQKYVDIYKAMVANQQSYERGLEDLKLVCDGYIENLRRKMPCEKIGKYLQESDQRNDIGLSTDSVRGISTNKELIPTKADMDGVELDNYKIVKPGQIAYVPDTSRRGDKISLGFNNTQDTFLVSSIYTVFGTKTESLIPEYLMLFLTRAEFDRYARFHSWGSARETFDWDEMSDVKIPIPDVKIQKAIAEVFSVYNARKRINERLKVQIKDICPILIKGSLEEGST